MLTKTLRGFKLVAFTRFSLVTFVMKRGPGSVATLQRKVALVARETFRRRHVGHKLGRVHQTASLKHRRLVMT